ncbi:MAG TPA: amino acid adenylation domain-containing protein, partial [Blastocatellia bacterium]|nr:amino acid adenylation domain-containing protein [Blastocatellia bacterium]
ILKAGGAYVPLDPAYPADRLTFMLEDARAAVLLTRKQLWSSAGEKKIKITCVDSERETIGRNSAETPLTQVRPDNLAYLIYTSGSTGKPKGVAIEHKSAVTFLHWVRDVFSAERLAGVLAATSICFDLSVFELFAPLSWGGKVILARDALQLPSLIAVDEVTLVNTVPSAMTELARMDGLPASAHTVNLAGERLQSKLVRQIYQKQTVEQVFNLYGPSEDTTYSSFALVQKEDGDPTIGRPIANTQMYILDPHLEPVPIGVAGELYIGGQGLARSYFNRPEITAERFIPNPYGKIPGQRIYRTGDLVRYLPDGNIDYLGRIDHQVKIRGFRIELGEIESVLSEHPAVRDSAVSVSEGPEDDKRLTAYVVPAQSPAPSHEELRGHLKRKLPDHMVPSVFIVMDALPLTPNGKINRAALPEPGYARFDSGRAIAPPRDGIEAQLVRIWEAVLNAGPVGVTDNFFEVGGHSLLALHLLARIRSEFGRDFPLSVLLRESTVEGMASFLRLQQNAQIQTHVVGLQTAGSKPPFFCIHPIGGDVFCYIELSRRLGSDQPFYALQAPGLYGEREPYTDIEELAALYISEVRAVAPQGPYLLGGWSFGGVAAFEMAQQLRKEGQEVALLALFDSRMSVTGHGATDCREDEARAAAAFLIDLARMFKKDVEITDEFRRLGPTDLEEYIFDHLRRLSIVPSDTDLKQVRNLLRVFKSNRRALKTYRPQFYTGASLLVRADEATGGPPHDPTLGWGRFLGPALEVCEVPGNHYTMMAAPHVGRVAEKLKGFLDRINRHDLNHRKEENDHEQKRN